MEPFTVISFLLLLVSLSPVGAAAMGSSSIGAGTDHESLVFLKNQLSKEGFSSCLSSWNQSKVHFCAWRGVSCGRKHPERVTALNLSSCGLAGRIPPSIANLTFLQSIDLSSNELHGDIPPSFLSRLQRLQSLILSSNSFHGTLPTNLTSLLTVLDLSKNNFSGEIPSAFFFMPNLRYIRMSTNYLSGIIPPAIFNLSFLREISLSDNLLSGGFPDIFPNSLPTLKILNLGGNVLSGSLQPLCNVSSLVQLDAPNNKLAGRLPPDLGYLQNLNSLNLENNELESNDAESWKFLDSLTNCSALQVLSLEQNQLGGVLPKSIANLSTQLQFLSIGRNHISGSIPSEIDNLDGLNLLAMEFNNLTGIIPKNIGKLKLLQELSFGGNELTGAIPLSLANLSALSQLDLGDNKLTGLIPSNFGDLQGLNFLNLEHNMLTGSIPERLFTISALSIYLGLAGNLFVGTLSEEVGKLGSLNVLDLSYNKFTGRIPAALGNCKALSNLYMDNNLFNGSIPMSMTNLKSLKVIDLSQNNLSGDIPPLLQNLTLLRHLNLSYNNLVGEVPVVGVFRNASEIALFGNTGLCGGISELRLPACENIKKKKNSHHKLRVLTAAISALLLLAILVSVAALYKYRKHRERSRKASEPAGIEEPFPKISYAELVKATDEFSPLNLIGRGRYGSVYRGALQEGQSAVAIKVFHIDIPGGVRSFAAECDALRSIRHRNLVKVLTVCSSIDFKGSEFKALVFEFMPKGNLEIWLHQESEGAENMALDLGHRLSIAADVADALEYLHHDCQPSIIHFDMKPSNILLDDDMRAHVGDFGLSRFLPEALSISLQDSYSKSWIKGTIGYVAPEYGGAARPSTSADVYSFGILVLELLTGRRPTDDMFKDGLELRRHVELALPHTITDIVDLKILANELGVANKRSGEETPISNCFLSMAEIGLSCSVPTPEDRPCMRDVAAKLHALKAAYLQSKIELD
ncbi:putative receptor-like protein kinase [Platanthera guangdongensis]|uniref:Receptor-like protein kinase n=1 Tax=Platanthera guangdongensis TaxID=2320717 RepID=A0ABR2LEB3_9ASPA